MSVKSQIFRLSMNPISIFTDTDFIIQIRYLAVIFVTPS